MAPIWFGLHAPQNAFPRACFLFKNHFFFPNHHRHTGTHVLGALASHQQRTLLASAHSVNALDLIDCFPSEKLRSSHNVRFSLLWIFGYVRTYIYHRGLLVPHDRHKLMVPPKITRETFSVGVILAGCALEPHGAIKYFTLHRTTRISNRSHTAPLRWL